MRTILIIDDDQDVREVLQFALTSEGFNVLMAENGLRALKLLNSMDAQDYPDLIIVDNIMPEMDGVTFIQEIKTNYASTLGKIPVALSSAMGEVDPALEQYEELMVLHKPMDLDDLTEMARGAGEKKAPTGSEGLSDIR